MKPRTPRGKIERAFRALRQKGYDCRANFKCCQSCGVAAILGRKRKGKYVFWHSQNHESFGKGGNLEARLYLYWDGDGKEIVKALRTEGLKVAWKGSEHHAIEVSDY